MKQDNVIRQKSYDFAIRIIRLCKYLRETKQEYVLAKQILRSGTSVGANVEEAISGQSDKDFLNKLSIAYKEARETSYWLRLLHDTEYLEPTEFKSLHKDIEEILKILGSIQKTIKSKSS